MSSACNDQARPAVAVVAPVLRATNRPTPAGRLGSRGTADRGPCTDTAHGRAFHRAKRPSACGHGRTSPCRPCGERPVPAAAGAKSGWSLSCPQWGARLRPLDSGRILRIPVRHPAECPAASRRLSLKNVTTIEWEVPCRCVQKTAPPLGTQPDTIATQRWGSRTEEAFRTSACAFPAGCDVA